MLSYPGMSARLALFVLLTQAKPVPMRDVSLNGSIDPTARAFVGKVVAVIGTPIGRIPITGNVSARVTCTGTFSGYISYSRIVRVFAALKRVDLVTQLDGAILDSLPDLDAVVPAAQGPALAATPTLAAVAPATTTPPAVTPAATTCSTLSADTVQGKAVVERTELRGALKMASDSVHFTGPAWTVGDSTYHSVVRVTRDGRVTAVRVNMYERGHSRQP